MHLLERRSSLEILEQCARDLSAGEGRIALVSGEAGLGKTSLVEHFASAHRRRERVFWGRCDPLYTPAPLAPFQDIAEQMGGWAEGFLGRWNREQAQAASYRAYSKNFSGLAQQSLFWRTCIGPTRRPWTSSSISVADPALLSCSLFLPTVMTNLHSSIPCGASLQFWPRVERFVEFPFAPCRSKQCGS